MDADIQDKYRAAPIAVLFFRLGPYHYARLKAASSAMRITAVEFSDVDPTYAWNPVHGQEGFDRVLLFPSESVESQTTRDISDTIDGALTSVGPCAVAISGWRDRCSIIALKWCMLHSVPVILMSETTAWDAKRKAWRELIKKRVVRLCSAGLVGGKSHADYLERLGMSRDRVFKGYDAVDNDYFTDKAEEVRSRDSEVRRQLGLPERYFLASARFVKKKNLPRLIQAYARYRRLVLRAESSPSDFSFQLSEFQRLKTPPSALRPLPSPSAPPSSAAWNLVLLGDGPLKPDLCHLISDLGLQHSVLLPGFKQYNELPPYYALGGAFVHASTTEQWGLVVNEAMASGLPVLVSDRCGCAINLVQEGQNGFVFDPYNVEGLAELMSRVCALPSRQLAAMGQVSREIIASWGPQRFAKGLCEAAQVAANSLPKRANFVDRLLLKALLARKCQ